MEYEKIPIGQAKDLTNQRFGNLVALYRTKNHPSYRGAIWVCQCDCGTIKPIPAQHLIKGNTISCGCQNHKKASERMLAYNLSNQTIKIGDKFGKLTVIGEPILKPRSDGKKREAWYLCQCDCGSPPFEVMGKQLRCNFTTSCGCISSKGEAKVKEILLQNNVKFKQEYSFADLINPNTNARLRFDFAVFDNDNNLNYLIEYDGRQHYYGPDTTVWTHYKNKTKEEVFEDMKFRDNLKNEYCLNHQIILKRIPYWILDNLTYEDILSNKFNINGRKPQ